MKNVSESSPGQPPKRRKRQTSTPEEDTELGLELAAFRHAQRLTQRVMARRLGLTPKTLSQMEHGAQPITAAVLKRLATAFQVSLDTVLSLTTQPPDLQEWLVLGEQLSASQRRLVLNFVIGWGHDAERARHGQDAEARTEPPQEEEASSEEAPERC